MATGAKRRVDLAGCKVGLGDGRPEFGQFAVTRFEAI
jgi:hypothetical protein